MLPDFPSSFTSALTSNGRTAAQQPIPSCAKLRYAKDDCIELLFAYHLRRKGRCRWVDNGREGSVKSLRKEKEKGRNEVTVMYLVRCLVQ